MLNFSHTYLYFKDLTRTYFCEIYVILWDLIEVKKTKFLIPKICDLAFCWSVDRDRSRSTGLVDRCAQTCTGHLAKGAVDRQRTLLSGSGPCRLGGRPADSSALCIQASVDRAFDRWHNGRKSDSWPIDRAVDRQQNFSVVLAQRLFFKGL